MSPDVRKFCDHPETRAALHDFGQGARLALNFLAEKMRDAGEISGQIPASEYVDAAMKHQIRE